MKIVPIPSRVNFFFTHWYVSLKDIPSIKCFALLASFSNVSLNYIIHVSHSLFMHVNPASTNMFNCYIGLCAPWARPPLTWSSIQLHWIGGERIKRYLHSANICLWLVLQHGINTMGSIENVYVCYHSNDHCSRWLPDVTMKGLNVCLYQARML